MVRNVHERWVVATPEEAGAVLDSLTGPEDRLWPHGVWPSIRMDVSLAVGASGGHGPIRYSVEEYEPGRRVQFRFSDPDLIDGWRAFEAGLLVGLGEISAGVSGESAVAAGG